MAELKYTPGPWNRGIAQNVYQGARWDPSEQQRMIASCEPTTRTAADWEQVWANATLIAAAPDLLAALMEFSGVWDSGHTFAEMDCDYIEAMRARARAAIAKATGGA
jgi:hypothetical protein